MCFAFEFIVGQGSDDTLSTRRIGIIGISVGDSGHTVNRKRPYFPLGAKNWHKTSGFLSIECIGNYRVKTKQFFFNFIVYLKISNY